MSHTTQGKSVFGEDTLLVLSAAAKEEEEEGVLGAGVVVLLALFGLVESYPLELNFIGEAFKLAAPAEFDRESW